MPWIPPTHHRLFCCFLTAHFLVYFHELHEGLCLVHGGILCHPGEGLLQGIVYDVGGVIIIITSIIITSPFYR